MFKETICSRDYLVFSLRVVLVAEKKANNHIYVY